MLQTCMASGKIAHGLTSAAKQSQPLAICHQGGSGGRVHPKSAPKGAPKALVRHQLVSLGSSRQQYDHIRQLEVQPSQLSNSSSLLWGLPNEQRQTLLFLAMSSALLATADVSQAADLQVLADLSVDRGQVISFLVNNPFVTLGVAVALYLIVPRVLRLATKYILLPAAVAGGVYLVITNPSTSWSVVSTGFGYVINNPAIASVAILGALALALSPYVLVIGGIVLVFSATSLPGPLKKLLPGPIVEADRQLDFVREQVKGPTAQAAAKLKSIFGGNTKALSPAHLDSSRLLEAPTLSDKIIDIEQ